MGICFIVERSEKLSSMRSTSTLPIPHPGSHPPTPTILVQSATGGEEGDERGDLILFYNRVKKIFCWKCGCLNFHFNQLNVCNSKKFTLQVFVEKVKKFAQKFSAQKNSKASIFFFFEREREREFLGQTISCIFHILLLQNHMANFNQTCSKAIIMKGKHHPARGDDNYILTFLITLLYLSWNQDAGKMVFLLKLIFC